jgi:hypothetical protein
MVGVRAERLELDEAWSFVGKKHNHVAAVALYVAHNNLCRVYEALRTTPARALGPSGLIRPVPEI